MDGDVFWRGTDVCVCVCMCVRVRTGAALAAVCVQRPPAGRQTDRSVAIVIVCMMCSVNTEAEGK